MTLDLSFIGYLYRINMLNMKVRAIVTVLMLSSRV